MGGKVSVESTYGKGTKFCILINTKCKEIIENSQFSPARKWSDQNNLRSNEYSSRQSLISVMEIIDSGDLKSLP